MNTPDKLTNFLNRRRFLKVGGLAAAMGLGLSRSAAQPVAAAPAVPPVAAAPVRQQMTADEMDLHHEEGVKAFVANIGKDKDFWGVMMPYTMDGNVKVFNITCTEGPWETAPGMVADAMMYNGRVPGEIIRVTEGDRVRFNVTNQMTQSTAVHWHGVHTPNAVDGVPFITQPVIKPGKMLTYEFVAKPPGTHMYHSHHNSTEQVTRGLMGAFIIDPLDRTGEPRIDAEYLLVLNDTAIGFSLNGRGFPVTQPILAKKGDRIRIRYMNEGLMIHPMHLHGMYQTVIAKDGARLPAPYLVDTLNIAPGERYDVIVDCEEPGVWAFHCHILSHAEGPNGMFGMVTALVIK
jgi:FtsP/CotA-like multicopper oxidase with cupredoxin domain